MDTETKPSIFLYSTSKDASISKFDFYTGKLLAYIPGGLKRTRKLKSIIGNKGEITQNWVGKARGAISVGGGKGAHTDEVLCSSVSFDGKFLVIKGEGGGEREADNLDRRL